MLCRSEEGTFQGDTGLHDTRRARGIRGPRNFREEYTDGEKMREQVSPGGMPVDPARVSRVGREITFRPNGRRPEGAIPPPGRDR